MFAKENEKIKFYLIAILSSKCPNQLRYHLLSYSDVFSPYIRLIKCRIFQAYMKSLQLLQH